MPNFLVERYRGRRRLQVALVVAPDAGIVGDWAALAWPGDEAVMSAAPESTLVTRDTVERLRIERLRPGRPPAVTGSTELIYTE
jgi:hypothetical protein